MSNGNNNRNHQQQGQRGQTLSQLANERIKKKTIPDALRFFLYGSFIWSSFGAVMYASGMWKHKDATDGAMSFLLDQFVSWSVGACAVFATILLYFVIVWLEDQ